MKNRCINVKRLIVIVSLMVFPPVMAASKPNVVLMFIDDMGYGDIGPFGNTVNNTPNLDRMAEEGNRLTQFYVSNLSLIHI